MTIDCTTREIAGSFSVEDVTEIPARLATAFDLLIAGYRALSSTDIDVREVYETVCHDAYQRNGLSRTLLLTGLNPDANAAEPLGTLRITPASATALKHGLPPLEVMELMSPMEGWNSFRFQGFETGQIVEGGRIALGASCRTPANKERNLPGLVLYSLISAGFQIASRDFGKTQYWGILPAYMIKRFEAVGIRVIPAPLVQLRREKGEFFQKYDRYWLKNSPCFCKVIVTAPGD